MNFETSMKTKHAVPVTLSGLVAIAALISQPAVATDDKTYPDYMCQPSGGDAARYFSGTVNIDPNFGHFLYCPIVRDTMAESGIGSASITVVDLSPVEDVECGIYSLNKLGGIVASSNRKTSSASASYQTLQFGSLSSADGGHYNIVCRIPKSSPKGNGGYDYSYILSYRVNENE
jgi:hypothetical protein